MELTYNTQEKQIILGEYGRGIQAMVEHLKTIENKADRSAMAKGITGFMLSLNPAIKEQDNYTQTLWDHLHIIGNYELDIDSEYPKPEPEEATGKPNHIGYKGQLTKYRFYGRNLIEMIALVQNLEEGELKTSYLNYIASFMVNSSRNWNDEDLSLEQVVQHLADLSDGNIQLTVEDLDIHIETRKKRPNHGKNKKSNKNHSKNKHRRR